MIDHVPSLMSHSSSGLFLSEIYDNERNLVLHEIDYDEWLLLNNGTTLAKSHFPWPLANKVIRLLQERFQYSRPDLPSNAFDALLETQHEYLQMTPIHHVLEWRVHDLYERYVCDLGVYSYLQFESAEAVDIDKVSYAHEQLMSILSASYRTLKQIEQVPCLSAQRLRQELIQSYLFSGVTSSH